MSDTIAGLLHVAFGLDTSVRLSLPVAPALDADFTFEQQRGAGWFQTRAGVALRVVLDSVD